MPMRYFIEKPEITTHMFGRTYECDHPLYNCSTCHRKGTGSVKLNRSGAYMVSFHANVTGATAATPVQLALALGGDVMPETTMIFTPETANTVGQVSICLPVFNSCCDYDRVTVVNTGTTDIVISANPMLAISKMGG